MKLEFENILEKILLSSAKGKTKLIAIDGRGGSGKTFLTKSLIGLDPSLKLISIVDFSCTEDQYPFHPTGTQTRIDVNCILNEALIPLSSGLGANFKLRPYYDLSIWVESFENAAVEKAILRDGESSRQAWIEVYVPNENNCIVTQKPNEIADLVVQSSEIELF